MVLAHKLLTGKRKLTILWLLSSRVMRYNEILKCIPDITKKMLTAQLRSLEEDHLITRRIYPTVPAKVEYAITEIGKQTVPIMEMMHHFGICYIDTFRDEMDLQRRAE